MKRRVIRTTADDKSSATITLKVNGQTQGSFRLDEENNKTINLSIVQPEFKYGINASRKIANIVTPEQSGGASWTATEDCFCFLRGTAYGSVRVDGVTINGSSTGNFEPYQIWLPIKKGTTVAVYGIYNNYIWAWALK